MNLPEDTDLALEANRQPISKEQTWKDLQGAAGRDLTGAFAEFKKQEREHEDSRTPS